MLIFSSLDIGNIIHVTDNKILRAELRKGYYNEGWVLWRLHTDLYMTVWDLEQILNKLKELNDVDL